MSFILDALKKSENERQRQLGPASTVGATLATVIGRVAKAVWPQASSTSRRTW